MEIRNRLAESLPVESLFDAASEPFVGRWNQLVSTTNWEKGRIILQWRDSLIDGDAPSSEYSDDAWSQRVGGVSSQHVGRLRRVYERFGSVHEEFDGLFWSHFQAALDWDDAEMWLEGAVQNGWSVSRMRHVRWETLGKVESEPNDEQTIVAELDEDVVDPELDLDGSASAQREAADEPARRDRSASAATKIDADDEPEIPDVEKDQAGRGVDSEVGGESLAFVRPFENLSDLPADLAEAFDAFKLAILRHKTSGWDEISLEDVLASLDALKCLALAPADSAPPPVTTSPF